MTHKEICDIVRQFVQDNFIFDGTKKLQDGESLMGSGVVDSTGIVELIGFLEDRFNVKFKDDELVADNFDSISKVGSFLSKKIGTETG